MGKLNVAKMANFMEVDVYVLVACPESSIVDSQVKLFTQLTTSTPCPNIDSLSISASDLITFYRTSISQW